MRLFDNQPAQVLSMQNISYAHDCAFDHGQVTLQVLAQWQTRYAACHSWHGTAILSQSSSVMISLDLLDLIRQFCPHLWPSALSCRQTLQNRCRPLTDSCAQCCHAFCTCHGTSLCINIGTGVFVMTASKTSCLLFQQEHSTIITWIWCKHTDNACYNLLLT